MDSRLNSSTIVNRLLMVALLLCVFGLSSIVVMHFALRGRTVEVPNVIGKTETAAAEELDDYGLRMQVKSRLHDNRIPANLVSDQSPAPGTTVKTGQLVRVSVSLGAPPSKPAAN